MIVLIVGAGGQGAPCASILAHDPSIKEIRIADIDLDICQKVAQKIGSSKIIPIKSDASDIDDITNAAWGVDVIIDLVTPIFFVNIMKAALNVNAHYVNTAWEEFLYEGYEEHDVKLGAKLKMYDDFAQKGLTAVLGCGMTSGFASNVLVRYYADKLDTVESVKFRLAKKDTSISDEEEIIQPWNPGWNPKQAVLDFVIPAYVFRDGEYIRLDEPFAEPELWHFPEPIGKTLVSHHSHEEPFCIPHLLAEKGLKYCDFKYYVNKQIAPIIALGLGSEEKIEIEGAKIAPLDVVLAMIPPPGDAFLNEDPSTFEYLDKTKFVSIMIEMKGTKDGKDITYLIHIPSMNTPRKVMYDLYGTSIISVALPAAIGAKMACEGTTKSVVHPHDLNSNQFIELMLETGYPNTWEEKVFVEK